MVEAIELRKLDLFSGLSYAQVEAIGKLTRKRTFKTGSCVYKQGDEAREVFILATGLVSLRGLKSPDELVVAFEHCEPGDLFGAASVMRGHQYTLTAVCVEQSEVLSIDSSKLSRLCETDFELGYQLMKRIAEIYFDRFEAAKKEFGIPIAIEKKR